MFGSGNVLRPPVDPSGINIFRLHREPIGITFLLELPGREDAEAESYELDQLSLEWWLDRMFEGHSSISRHHAVRRNEIVDYVYEFYHMEYDFLSDKLTPLPNWPEPESEEIRQYQNEVLNAGI